MTTLNVVRALNNSGVPERLYPNSSGYLGWTNCDFKNASPPTGDDPIDLMLRLLISTGAKNNWSGAGTNYDYYDEAGVGLGIPQDRIDIPSFTAIQAQYDYDSSQRVFFHIIEPMAAKEFIEQELCLPFGLYLLTGNDGKIKLIRPRHPQKFYIGNVNKTLTVKYPATTGTIYNATLPIGVYTAQQLATSVATAINAVVPGAGFSCSYNTSTWKFTLSKSNAFDLLASPDAGWTTAGWTTVPVNNTTSTTSQTARGQFTGPTLTEKDMWGVQQVDNRDDQVSSVVYMFDYDVDKDAYRSSRRYVDTEAVNLGDTMAAHELVIRSRGLISADANAASWVVHFKAPVSGCDPDVKRPTAAAGVDADTWAKLYAHSVLDRYKQPPLKFRARLKWTWNTLEVGDVVKVNYSIPGIFSDYERNSPVLSNRLFEIVELHPNFDGSLDATFLGHRYVSY
jgi:hypothetical protein